MTLRRRYAQGSPTQRKGSAAEMRAERWLVDQGFRVLARNHVCRGGEVDLVVEKGELVVFVEVRSTATMAFGGPLATVTPAKQRRVVKAARDWLWRNHAPDRMLRFDVIGIVGDELTVIPNAFSVP